MTGSKSNVHPDHYKVAGRGRQGEDIIQEQYKKKYREAQERAKVERRTPKGSQVSTKKGKRSNAQKEGAARHDFAAIPATKQASGAFGNPKASSKSKRKK